MDRGLGKENVVYIYTMEFQISVKKKKNETMTFASKWIKVKIIVLNEINHTRKTKNWLFSLICRNQI